METPRFTLEFEKPVRELENQIDRLRKSSADSDIDMDKEIKAMENKLKATSEKIYKNLTSWQKILIARHPKRPYALDYVNAMFDDFQELHGDRLYRDDLAIIGGPAQFNGQPVMVIGQQKGRSTKENLARNFGCPNPEGYRKALRLMKLATRFNMPIICLIDTPGAYPGIGAEERHVAEAIAVNIREMSDMPVPIIAVVIGEGGSGGALGIAIADKVLILQNAYYSVISPEGCAAILWKDRSHAERAANALKITADKLLELGIVDEMIKEPQGGAHHNPKLVIESLRKALEKNLAPLRKTPLKSLLEKRYSKFRNIGVFDEDKAAS